MAEPARQYDRERMCLGKSVYMTRRRAERTVDKVWEKRGVRLRIYECPCCLFWHVTKQPLRRIQ